MRQRALTHGFAVWILAISFSAGCADAPRTPESAGSDDGGLSSSEIGRSIAQDWIEAWNTADIDALARLHDEDLLYYWRGSPRGYDQFMEELRLFIFPDGEATEEPTAISDVRVQEMTSDVLVVGFHMGGPAANEPPGAAVTLVVAHRASGWKITHIHESPVL